MSVLRRYNDVPDDINILSKNIVDAAFQIHTEMGPGLSEAIYEDCFAVELSDRGINFDRQRNVDVYYKNQKLPSTYKIDLLIENKIIVELKAVDRIVPIHETQIMTYMNLVKAPLGLLINFNVPLIKDGIKRVVISNNFETSRLRG